MWFRCVAVVVVAAVWWRGVEGVEEGVVEHDPVGCGPAVTLLVERGVVEKSHLSRLPSGGEFVCTYVCGWVCVCVTVCVCVCVCVC